jgi:Na+/proline symporter
MLSPSLALALIAGYFLLLILIAALTSRKATSESFFVANRAAPWPMVAFAMVGTSLSGVTFVSVPGAVAASGWSYLAVVLGYIVGYVVIATVLMPIYYRLRLTSIYTYLEQRFGFWSYKTGAGLFLVSRTVGAAFRLFLVAGVLQQVVFRALGVPFWLTVTVAIGLIFAYTFKGGLRTILWTDTFQTAAMLVCVAVSIGLIAQALHIPSVGVLWEKVRASEMSRIYFGDLRDDRFFWKQFVSGIFITIVMTGLDQDLMQKNLACRSLRDAQKNMAGFAITLVGVNLLFLTLGVLLYLFAASKGIELPRNAAGGIKGDEVFPLLATQHFTLAAAVVFLLGIVAVTYASADSALTALTTSYCVDFLDLQNRYRGDEVRQTRIRRTVHLAFAALLVLVILAFERLNDQSVITAVFKAAGYTYGPLLGLFAFGILTRRRFAPGRETLVPVVCVVAPLLTWLLNANSEAWLNGYKFGFEILLVNGALTLIGLALISSSAAAASTQTEQLVGN